MLKKVLGLVALLILVSVSGFAYNQENQNQSLYIKLKQLYTEYRNLNTGEQARYIPELAKVDPNLFAIVITKVDGETISVGDAEVPFAIESISKPFVYGLVLSEYGEKYIFDKLGLNATGHPFNSLVAIHHIPDHIQNPYVNAGAIQATNLIQGENTKARFDNVLNFFNELSNAKLAYDQKIYLSESSTNMRNRAIIAALQKYGMVGKRAEEALDRYTKACSIMVTAKQLAMMGATLANNGINPITKKRILSRLFAKDVLAEMVVNGLYENSGTWFVEVGLPAKSGVSGAILAIVPGKMAIVVYSPRLDNFGNSVRAQEVIRNISKNWQLHLLNH